MNFFPELRLPFYPLLQYSIVLLSPKNMSDFFPGNKNTILLITFENILPVLPIVPGKLSVKILIL